MRGAPPDLYLCLIPLLRMSLDVLLLLFLAPTLSLHCFDRIVSARQPTRLRLEDDAYSWRGAV